ncbi:odorant receptor 4 [Solenopsis invicta]|uniref:odorant receptor 4 n=1 Tax=Solenopsis invicta TaxID=13686 RepID=UPI00193DFBF9|nr:odorant receptor 4 [Solenopsis invicta]
MPLIILKRTTNVIIKVLSSVILYILYLLLYHSLRLNIDVVKNLLMDFQHTFDKLKDENEIAIIEKYSCIAKRYTIACIAGGICVIFIIILTQFMSKTIVFVVSMNVSQPYEFHILMKYFIDQEKYFYLIVLHIYAGICFGIVSVVSVGTMLNTYVQHMCGMFRIASYRIEHAVSINIKQNITLENKILMIEGIACGVDIHRQAMKLTKELVSAFEIMLGCLIVSGVFFFILNLFQIAVIQKTFKELCPPICCVIGIVIYLLLGCYIGQDVMDHNNRIFSTAYNVQWYKAPIHVQKMILFILQKETIKFSMIVGGLVNFSIETFAMLVKLSVSYFTALYSTQ